MSTAAQEIALMKQKVESFEDKMDKFDEKLDAISTNLLDPDRGFVARVNKNTDFRREMENLVADIYAMKRWRQGVTWALRVMFAAIIGALAKLFMIS